MKYGISSRLTCPVFLCMFLALSLFPTYTNAVDTARQLESQVLDVRLHGALFKGENPEADGPTLMLDLAQEEGRWRRVWAVARDYNAAFHIGTVTASEVSPSKLELAVRLKIQGDSFGAGGRAMYRIELNQRHDGAFKGLYSGTFNGMAVKGKAEADFRPPYRRMMRNYRPFGPREHPRIFFRKEELPELREKASTLFGKAALEAMDSTEGKAAVIGKALKYQLTGDVKYADQIIPIIEEMMTRGHLSDQFGNNVGDRLEKMALAYDMCYDVWPAEFKKRVEDFMLWAANTILFHQKSMNRSINWHICSNWSAPLYTGVGFAGLALLYEKGPAPTKLQGNNSGAKIQPATNYKPGKGVTIHKFSNGEMPDDWIYVGGFKSKPGQDPLVQLGGAAKARPEIDTVIDFGGCQKSFRRLSREKDKGYWQHPNLMRGKEMIDVTNAIGRVFFSTSFFYAVIDNDRPRWVSLATGNGSVYAYLNGMRLSKGECAFLETGLYPFMVVAPIGWTEPWGRILTQPRLIEQTEENAREISSLQRTEYEEKVKDWQYDLAEWRRLDGANIDYLKLFEMGRRMMYLHYREAVGTGGFQGELTHYSLIATRPCARYASAYRQMFGVDVSTYDDITYFVPRKMFAQVYRPDGQPLAQEINGSPIIDSGYFGSLFPIIPDKWKRAALWAWNYHAGVQKEPQYEGLFAREPVLAFLNYPLDLASEHPRKTMPLTWQARDFGYFAFRNSWDGTDDFILQIFLKSHHIGGWNAPNAGTFRLLGLGHIWAYGPTDRNRHRWEENVVMLPDNPEINLSAGTHLTYIKTLSDGSGIISFDMNDLYAMHGPLDDRGRRPRLYQRYGNIRHESAFANSGITGMRAIAVDYSGKSGAACLLAIVDRIKGGGSKVWVWQLADQKQKRKKDAPDPLHGVSTKGNTFTIRKPDGANLRGTFIAPRNVRVSAELRHTTMAGRAGSTAGKTLQRPVYGVFAEGGDNFFVVVTIQRGEPSAVEIEAEGHNTRVRVGRRTIYLDGDKIVFE